MSERRCHRCEKLIPREQPSWYDQFQGTYTCKPCLDLDEPGERDRLVTLLRGAGVVLDRRVKELEVETKRLQRIADAAMSLFSAREAGQDDEETAVCWEELEMALKAGPSATPGDVPSKEDH